MFALKCVKTTVYKYLTNLIKTPLIFIITTLFINCFPTNQKIVDTIPANSSFV